MSKIEEFESILKNDTKYKIVQVSATWCKPCNIIKPLIDTYLKEIIVKIDYIKLDYDIINEIPEFEKYFQVKKLPYFVLYKDNIKIEEFSCGDFNNIKNKFDGIINNFEINNDF